MCVSAKCFAHENRTFPSDMRICSAEEAGMTEQERARFEKLTAAYAFGTCAMSNQMDLFCLVRINLVDSPHHTHAHSLLDRLSVP